MSTREKLKQPSPQSGAERQRRSVMQPRVAPGATLGWHRGNIEPQRGSGGCVVLRSRNGGQNPFRVRGFSRTVSQGSSFLATLGFGTESRWDSLLAEFWKLEKEAEKMLEGLAK
jgi:hypothetical protein